MAEPVQCGLVLLAAGGSRRMGRPKQLLAVGGQPLVRHMAGIALAAPVSPVVVVLGACAAEIAPTLDGLSVHVVTHPHWAEGMGSSLRAGVAAALRLAPQLRELFIVLADQPNLTVAHLREMLDVRHRTGRSLIASVSDGIAMPPVLFAAAHFPRLLALRGDAGARALLHGEDAAFVPVPAGPLLDLDTPADYAALIQREATGRE